MRPTVFVGYDARQPEAYRACVNSLRMHSPDVLINPVSRQLLGGLYQRPTSQRDRVLWDDISNAPMSTDFALARFWVPYLAQQGWVVYCDNDFLWRAPVEELLRLADPVYAVQVVKHEQEASATPKMDGQVQTAYARKNWSSLMLFNCDAMLDAHMWLDYVNRTEGLNLHQFTWAGDKNIIGPLPPEWNYLVGVNPPMENPKAVHFTLGTPNLPGYEKQPFADEWRGYQ